MVCGRGTWKRWTLNVSSLPGQGPPTPASFTREDNRQYPTWLRTSIAVSLWLLYSRHLQCDFETNPGSSFSTNRALSMSLATRSTSRPHTSRIFSACFWTPMISKHLLTFPQYQVFQDLQGPASSLRVGSSVRTSTRPLSVSLLRLCLRYLTCIQRR